MTKFINCISSDSGESGFFFGPGTKAELIGCISNRNGKHGYDINKNADVTIQDSSASGNMGNGFYERGDLTPEDRHTLENLDPIKKEQIKAIIKEALSNQEREPTIIKIWRVSKTVANIFERLTTSPANFATLAMAVYTILHSS